MQQKIGGGYAEYASRHDTQDGRNSWVHNQLVMGDKVIMLKETGGQRYIALEPLV